MPNPQIAPSMLASDFGRLAEQLEALDEAGADQIHLDVMDGRFVPNLSFGPVVIEACRRTTALPLDVHLMVENPERSLAAYAEAGADTLTVHAEASLHLHRTLTAIRELGCRAGLAVNPLTPLEVVQGALPYLDLVLVMSVNPGFGGQSYIPTSTGRIAQVAAWRDGANADVLIEVDGGIHRGTAAEASAAGADILVAGSAVFAGGAIAENVAALRRSALRR